jgi:cell division protein FtsB
MVDAVSERARPTRPSETAGERGAPGAASNLFARVSSVVRDALPLAILGAALIFVPVLVFEPQGLPRLRGLERDLEQVEAENRNLEREIALTRMQVRLLKDDLPSVERVARTELGLVRKSEIVLQLPQR